MYVCRIRTWSVQRVVAFDDELGQDSVKFLLTHRSALLCRVLLRVLFVTTLQRLQHSRQLVLDVASRREDGCVANVKVTIERHEEDEDEEEEREDCEQLQDGESPRSSCWSHPTSTYSNTLTRTRVTIAKHRQHLIFRFA